MSGLSDGAVLVWALAADEARVENSSAIEPAHLLLGAAKLCDRGVARALVADAALDATAAKQIEAEVTELRGTLQEWGVVDIRSFRHRLRGQVRQSGQPPGGADAVLHRSVDARRVFARAEELAAWEAGGMPSIRASHLVRALQEIPNPPWADLLVDVGGRRSPHAVKSRTPTIASDAGRGPSVAGSDTPNLDRFGRDLTQLAGEGRLDPVIGRRDEMRALARVLAQHRKNNPLLVGDAGVGKTCIVEGLAQRIVHLERSAPLAGTRIVELSIGALVAGTKYRGEFEERVQTLIEELRVADDVVVFIDEIHTVLGAGDAAGGVDAANMLKPALARGDIRLIGATTIGEYRQHIERDPALERRFQLVWVDEPTPAEALEILEGLTSRFEQHHGLTIDHDALEAAVELSVRYLPDLRLPDKAVDLVDQACAARRIRSLSISAGTPEDLGITRADIAGVVARRARVPVERLTADEGQRLLQMEEALASRVIGQEDAVASVCHAVRSARAGLKDPHRPVVLLFVGATGTGKTELAKALAEFLFEDPRNLIRIDMSEYKEAHSISRLIGAPPGYVGHDEEGQLTGAVRSRPSSVVLFDEVEKAHREVFDLFLQMFDEGQLTDARGRRASFTDAIIVLTSNLGSEPTVTDRPIGFGRAGARDAAPEHQHAKYRDQIGDALRRTFRPELLNRIHETVYFYPLDERALRGIVDKVLDGLRARLRDRDVDVRLTDAAYDYLVRVGFDPAYGARELERAVEQHLGRPLADALLNGHIADGARLDVDAREGELVVAPDETRPLPSPAQEP